jgi:hypothetical protein
MIELIFSGPSASTGVFDPVWMQQLARANLSAHGHDRGGNHCQPDAMRAFTAF